MADRSRFALVVCCVVLASCGSEVEDPVAEPQPLVNTPAIEEPTTVPDTKPERKKRRPKKPQGNCDPSYPDVCIPPPPPDLNCDDVVHTDFSVKGSDPHEFDSEGDGFACESA